MIFGRILAAIAVAAASLVLQAPAAHAAPAALPLTSFADMVVDDAHGKVFVSGGSGTSTIVVRGFGGSAVGSITGLPGPRDMVLHDGVLYVVMADGGRIDRFDADTLSPLGPLVSGLVEPSGLVLTDARLWLTEELTVDLTQSRRLVGLALDSGPALHWDLPLAISKLDRLAASPEVPGFLVAWKGGWSPGPIRALDVRGSVPAVVGSEAGGHSNVREVSFTPSGETVLVASGTPHQVVEYSFPSFTPTGVVYANGDYPLAVATTWAQGGLVATGRSALYDPDVDVYRLDDPDQHFFQHDWEDTDLLLYDRALAFSADGTRLFAVTGDAHPAAQTVFFDVFDLTADLPAPAPGSARAHLFDDSLDFGATRVGTTSAALTVTVQSRGHADLVVSDVTSVGPAADDVLVETDCDDAPLPAGSRCTVEARFRPSAVGSRSATLQINSDASDGPDLVTVTGEGTTGYVVATARGGARGFGDLAGVSRRSWSATASAVVGAATRPGGRSGWLARRNGSVVSFGGAPSFGSMAGRRLAQPIVGIAAPPSGRGYWLVAADGGVFGFGDARYRGAPVGRVGRSVVGIERTPTGAGYWIVTSDGRVLPYGGAGRHGSAHRLALRQPIVGMAARPSGAGYWLVGADGGLFAFGAARFHGSLASSHTTSVTGIEASPTGRGYWLVSSGGRVRGFGDAVGAGGVSVSSTNPAVDLAS